MNDNVEEQELELLKYPIGRFAAKGTGQQKCGKHPLPSLGSWQRSCGQQ